MLRRAYDWTIEQAERPHAIWLLAAVSFTEASVFPIPPDVLLVPMMLADRRRLWQFAVIATLSSVIGGFLGYAIGYYLFETVGSFIIEHLASMAAFNHLKAEFDIWGFRAIILKGLTPIPFKLVTILCGVMHYDLGKFALASAIARSIRFFPEAVLIALFGEKARAFIERRLVMATSLIAVALVGGFVALRYL